MNEWKYGMTVWMNELVYERINVCVYEWMINKFMNEWLNNWTNVWMYEWMNISINKLM